MADNALIGLGLFSGVVTLLKIKDEDAIIVEKVVETISIYSYKFWSNGMYHFDASDLGKTIGMLAGTAAIVLAGSKIYKTAVEKFGSLND